MRSFIWNFIWEAKKFDLFFKMRYNPLWNFEDRVEYSVALTSIQMPMPEMLGCMIQEGTSMALKKVNSTAKTTAKKAAEARAESAKTEEKTVKAETAKSKDKAEKSGPAKAIETKKDTTKKLETKAAVLVDTPAEEKTTARKTTAAKKTTAKKTTAKKTTAKKTTAAAKKAAKKSEISTEIFLQFSGKEYTQAEILQKIKDIWTYDLNNNVDDIKDVQIYLKPEESAAYYVVNGNTTGKVVL